MTDAPAPAGTTSPHRAARALATRDAIAHAARELFTTKGFADTSVRAIAAAAGTDPALVIRHFGSKEALFLQSMDTAADITDVLDGPLETLGRRLIKHYLGRSSDRTRQVSIALLQASHRPHVREEISRQTQRIFRDPLAARLTGERRDLRAALAWAQIAGLLYTRNLEESSAVLRDTDDVVALYGDTLQRLITP